MCKIPGLDFPGYKVVRFGVPRTGETFVSETGILMQCQPPTTGHPRLILEKLWEWPTWLKAKYIAMDADGTWYAYKMEPEVSYEIWTTSDHVAAAFPVLGLEGPKCDAWTKSLMENPHEST